MDEDLGGESSLAFVPHLVQQGVGEIYLSTGSSHFHQHKPEGISKVIDKNFPF